MARLFQGSAWLYMAVLLSRDVSLVLLCRWCDAGIVSGGRGAGVISGAEGAVFFLFLSLGSGCSLMLLIRLPSGLFGVVCCFVSATPVR